MTAPASPSNKAFLPPFNSSFISVSFPATAIRPFVPFQYVIRNGPFDAKSMWKNAVGSVRSIQQLSKGTSPTVLQKNDSDRAGEGLTVATGHSLGHLLLWNADTVELTSSCEHFNGATVTQVIVTNNYVYSIVEKQSGHGQRGDDTDVYMWTSTELTLLHKLSAHEERVTCIAVDERNDSKIVSCGADHLIFLWDIKVSSAVPVKKLAGHTSAVMKVAYAHNIVISGSGEGEIRVWDGVHGKCLHTFEGHQGAINFMEWSLKPTAATHFKGSLVTGCNGGLVRGWEFDPEESEGDAAPAVLQQSFFNKAHKAIVNDVAVDKEVVISCSTCDGVNLFHSAQKSNYKIMSIDSGVRAIAVDPSRSVLCVGTEKGQLIFFDYSNFATGKFHDDPVVMVASLHPHMGSITGILLERGRTGEWTRIISTSADSTIFQLDFDRTRGAKTLGSVTSTSVIRSNGGNFLLPLEGSRGNGAAQLHAPLTMMPVEGAGKQAELKAGTKVVQMKSFIDVNRLLIATDDGCIRLYAFQVFVPEDQDSSAQMEEYIDFTKGVIEFAGYSIRDISDFASPQFAAVGLQRSGSNRVGAFAIIDVVNEKILSEVVVTNYLVLGVSLYAYQKADHHYQQLPTEFQDPAKPAPSPPKKPHMFAVVVQMRNGEVQVYTGQSDAPKLTLIRTPVRDQLNTSSMNSTDLEHISSVVAPRIVSTFNTRYDPPKIQLLYVESGRTMKQIECSLAPQDNLTPSQFTAIYNFDINQVLVLQQGPLAFVVIIDSSTSYITGPKGEVLYEVLFDGGVNDCTVLDAMNGRNALKKHRSLITEDGGQYYSKNFPHCCHAAVCQESRFVAFGYRDGTIQLWDVATHKVFKRIIAHPGVPVVALWCFGEDKKIFSVSSSGQLRCDTVYPKTLRDGKNKSGAASVTPSTASLPGRATPPAISLH